MVSKLEGGPWNELYQFFEEFDPGSGLTLAACLTHASRADVARNIQLPTNNTTLYQNYEF